MKSSDEHVRPGEISVLVSPHLKQRYIYKKKKKKCKYWPHLRNTLKNREVSPQ